MTDTPSAIYMHGKSSTLIIDLQQRIPKCVYWGRRLLTDVDINSINKLSFRQEAKCAVVQEPDISFTPGYGQGFTGTPGLSLFNERDAWSTCGDIISVEQESDDVKQKVVIVSEDEYRGVSLVHTLIMYKKSDVLEMNTAVTNQSDSTLNMEWCAAPTLPLSSDMDKVLAFEGRWAKEFQQLPIDINSGGYVRENRKGHTSHDSFPGFIVHENTCSEQAGRCYGFHLGWSGNHRVRVESLSDGRRYAQLGELLLPGEVTLNNGESYVSPSLYVSFSDNGLSKLSNQFHHFVRQQLIDDKVKQKPRPVHYNTWEGIYFDHDEKTLMELATKAAAVGAERFVLDDGWFIGRRNDKAGLGDWFVDKEIYPNGLAPLISTVNELGMEFGIWFEPEMVNPDSNLYRSNPDWVLGSKNNPQINFRNQLVLDLTRREVTDYLFKCIDDILTEYPEITYIKWDMNRDLNHAGGCDGKPAVHKQTLALYQLIDKVKQHHPSIEIESCCSGGGRVDYGILKHTDRVWTSDSNDALDRLAIQRGCSFFIPSEIMGAHVGPLDCHITGRRVSMDMRAAVAMFGHMGIEMDPRLLTDEEEVSLKAGLKLYKKHRGLIHSGELTRLQGGKESSQTAINFAITNEDKTQGLYAFNQIEESVRYLPTSYKFTGLNPELNYRLDLVWPVELKEYSKSVTSEVNGQVFNGQILAEHGMQLPVVDPQSSLVFELTAVE